MTVISITVRRVIGFDGGVIISRERLAIRRRNAADRSDALSVSAACLLRAGEFSYSANRGFFLGSVAAIGPLCARRPFAERQL